MSSKGSSARVPLLQKNGDKNPVQESCNSGQSLGQSDVTGSTSSMPSSPTKSSTSSDNESGQGTSNSGQPQNLGAQQQGGDIAIAGSSRTGNESGQGTISSGQSQSTGAQQQVGGTPGSSGTQRRELHGFNSKMCIKFLPSRRALNEYQDIGQQISNYDRKNIKCKCGLAFKDHWKGDAKNKDLPLLYPTVQDVINPDGDIKEFIKHVFKRNKGEELTQGYKWDPNRLYHSGDREMSLQQHTMIEAEGAEFGDIEFSINDINDDTKPRSQFARLSDNTDMDRLKRFLKDQWKLLDPKPELLISLIGSTLNKKLVDKLVKSIMKISKSMNLIILTSGLENDLVAKKIGDAVTREQRWTTESSDAVVAKSKIKCVGITSWGALKENEKPVFKSKDGKTDIYKIPKNRNSNGHSCVLNPGHKYFLLVDTGTTWELSRELFKFCSELQEKMKDEMPNVLNLVLGTDKQAKYTVGMAEKLLANFPVVFLKHSGKYMDALIDSIVQFREKGGEDISGIVKSALTEIESAIKEIGPTLEKFLKNHVQQDYQEKNVMVVSDLLGGENNDLISAMLKTLTEPLIVKAKVNEGKPDNQKVLDVVALAVNLKLKHWEPSMDELFNYQYYWEKNEMQRLRLKDMLKDCLLQDMPELFPVFLRHGWLSIDKFLTVEMLAQLCKEAVVNDPIQVVFKREKIIGANTQELRTCIVEMVQRLWLPQCFLPVVKGTEELQYPYKQLLIWAVLSKKWKVVDYVLRNQKDDNILVWYLATAYLCRTVAARQIDMEIKSEFKHKQKAYEKDGRKLLEILHVQHDLQIQLELADGHNFTHLSLQKPSQTWGKMCPADLALLGNFKTFVRSEGFHKYIVKSWKTKHEGFCQTRVKFYTHLVFYMIMVLSFCAALISGVQHGHFAHQIWLLLWIFSYIAGEVYTRLQQESVKFCSRAQQFLLVTSRKYLHLLMLSCFLIGGFACSMAGSAHWGAMLYGIACLILILIIAGHFLASFHLFATQISILKKAGREIVTFIVFILLLIWAIAMIFNAILCLDDKIMGYPPNSTQTPNSTQNSVSKSWFNWGHTIWFLYLSLYGEYNFELDLTDEGHFSCMKDRAALMWVSYFLIGLHILVGNVLLMNLLVSIIGTKADNLKHDLVYQWKSNWYKQTLHYEAQTMLPPPFNMIELLVRLVCHCRRKEGQDETDAAIQPSKTILNLYQYQQEANRSLRDMVLESETRL